MKTQYLLYCILISCCTLVLPDSMAAQQAELRWVGHWKNEGGRSKLVEEIKKEYIFLHPEVRLHFRYNKDLENKGKTFKFKMANAIVKMVKTSVIDWDVIFLDAIVYAMVSEKLADPEWGKKHLVDFSTVPGFAATQKDFLLTDPYYRRQSGGIIVGPYVEGFVLCPWYNHEVAAKTGIKVQERGMTIENFIGYARELSVYNRKHGTEIPFIKLSTFNRLDYLFEYLFKSQFDDPHYAIEEKYDKQKDKAFLDTLLLFEQLSQYQPILDKGWAELTMDQWKREFLEGDGLFLIGGSYIYDFFRAIDPVKYTKTMPVEFPYVVKPNGLVAGYFTTFAVMKNSPNLQQAMDLMKLWSEPKVAERWVNLTKNPTGLRHLNEPVSSTGKEPYSRFIMDMQELYGHLPMRYLRSPVYAFGSDNPVSATELHDRLADILEAKITARQYYDDVKRRFLQNQKQTKVRHSSEQ